MHKEPIFKSALTVTFFWVAVWYAFHPGDLGALWREVGNIPTTQRRSPVPAGRHDPVRPHDPVSQRGGHAALWLCHPLRGHLRRHAAHHVLQALAARNETVSLPVYSCLQCGAWTGSPDGADLRYGEFLVAKKHPYLGLFGGGPRMIRRSFQATNALPALQSLRDALHIPSCAEPMPEVPVSQLTQIAVFRRNDDLADLANLATAAKTLKDFETSLRTYEAAVLSTGGARSDEEKKANAKVSSMTFSSMEFVIPGTSFDLSFDLFEDLTDAQIGLFLLSLDRFAQTDTLGGHSRNGFGRFFFSAVALEGEPVFRNGKLDRDQPAVQAYLQAWTEAANTMSVSELEYLFRVGGKKVKNKKDDGKSKHPELSALEALVTAQQGKMAEAAGEEE